MKKSLNEQQWRIGILGFGTVGQATFRLLLEHKDRIAKIMQATPVVVGATVRNLEKCRPDFQVPIHNNSADLVNRPDVDLIVETMGGIEPAHSLVRMALESGKAVVTANKELIAKHGEELIRLATDHGAPLLFEATVGGGIPIVKALHLQLQGNHITRIDGIFNGTTNFILSKMRSEGLSYEVALKLAQEAGFAESDPKNDVEGYDTAFKIAILGWLSQRRSISLDKIEREGISGIVPIDLRIADAFDCLIKLIGVFELRSDGRYGCRVRPMFVPSSHPYAAVENEFNAVTVYGDFAGPVTMMGKGAGGDPTASSIVGDIIASRLLISKMNWSTSNNGATEVEWEVDTEWKGAYCIRFPESMRSIVRLQMRQNNIDIVKTAKTIDDWSAFITSPVTEQKIRESLGVMPAPYHPSLLKWLPVL